MASMICCTWQCICRHQFTHDCTLHYPYQDHHPRLDQGWAWWADVARMLAPSPHSLLLTTRSPGLSRYAQPCSAPGSCQRCVTRYAQPSDVAHAFSGSSRFRLLSWRGEEAVPPCHDQPGRRHEYRCMGVGRMTYIGDMRTLLRCTTDCTLQAGVASTPF